MDGNMSPLSPGDNFNQKIQRRFNNNNNVD